MGSSRISSRCCHSLLCPQGRCRGPQNPLLDTDPPRRCHLQDQHLVFHCGCPGQTLWGLTPLRHCLCPHSCWQLPGTPPGWGMPPSHQRGPLAPPAAPCHSRGAAPFQPGTGRCCPCHGASTEPGRLLGVTPRIMGCPPLTSHPAHFWGLFSTFFFFFKTPGAAGLVLRLFNGCGRCPRSGFWWPETPRRCQHPETAPTGGGVLLFFFFCFFLMYQW